MKKKPSTAQRIRSLIDSGYNNKAIIEKLKCKPQAVYNIRYQLNKERGLGSIGALPKPTDGIGAPPKRTRKIRAGELASLPPTKPVLSNVAVNSQPIKAGEWVDLHMPITMIEKPTLWQRIKGWFRG
jgi:hypothetical protein